jgi:hypothetical protein
MLKLYVVLASILLSAVFSGCLEQTRINGPLTTSAATTTLKISAQPIITQSEYATFMCQLNVTRGPGLDNKMIRWSIDNVDKEATRTIRGVRVVELDYVKRSACRSASTYSRVNQTFRER